MFQQRFERIDKAIELGYMEKENKIGIATRILGEFPQEFKKGPEHIAHGNDETPLIAGILCANSYSGIQKFIAIGYVLVNVFYSDYYFWLF